MLISMMQTTSNLLYLTSSIIPWPPLNRGLRPFVKRTPRLGYEDRVYDSRYACVRHQFLYFDGVCLFTKSELLQHGLYRGLRCFVYLVVRHVYAVVPAERPVASSELLRHALLDEL